MNRVLFAIITLFFFVTSFAQAAADLRCTKTSGECDAVFEPVPGRKLKYTSTFNLNLVNPAVTSAVVMFHASDRKIQWGYDNLNGLMDKGKLSKDTLVVAPLLMAPADKPPADFLFWGSNEWSAGFDSQDGSKTSSFAAVDQLIRKIIGSGNFPNLKTMIVTGLSAGGQATQRYAYGTEIDHEFPFVQFRFIIVAPSSYVYLNGDRLVPGTQNQFAKPVNPGCNYNSYRYGPENPSSYLAKKSVSALTANFVARDLAIISGELDDATKKPDPPIASDPKDGKGLDVSCEAEWQGKSRIERSFIFHLYLTAEFPANRHVWFGVPGLAHSYLVYEDPRTVDLLNFR